jgi:hypothetical protein
LFHELLLALFSAAGGKALREIGQPLMRFTAGLAAAAFTVGLAGRAPSRSWPPLW